MNIDKFLAFCTEKHKGQFRKNSTTPYITHPIAVAKLALRGFNLTDENTDDEEDDNKEANRHNREQTEVINCIAYAHDILEDTNTTVNELIQVLTHCEAKPYQIDQIVDGVVRLTKNKGQDIIEYLTNIRFSGLATIVKLADLEHNSSDLVPGNLLDKYKLCQYFLNQKI